MAFWNEAFFFERRGERYVYRPTVFSAGFDVSADEKEELFQGLIRLNWQVLFWGLLLVGCIAAAFMTGLVQTNAKIQWFLFSSIVIVEFLTLIAIDRLVSQILRNRIPDVRRLPIRQALTTSHHPIGKQYAVPVLWSVAVLLGFSMAAVDATILYLVFTVAKDVATVPGFWVFLGALNAIMFAALVFAIHQARLVSKSES